MCCLRIDTEVILAQLFAASSYPACFTMEDIKRYFRFLSEKFPVYLTTNISEYNVVSCTEMYPELYILSRNENKGISVKSRDFYPNLEFFMEPYMQGVRNYMKLVTNDFLSSIEKK